MLQQVEQLRIRSIRLVADPRFVIEVRLGAVEIGLYLLDGAPVPMIENGVPRTLGQ